MTAECVSGGNVNECADTTLENHALLKVWIAENDAKGRNFQDILESNYPKSGKRTLTMIPETIYFSAYICIIDEKIYDECYFKMLNILQQEGFNDDVKKELLKILSDDESKISLDVIYEKIKNSSDTEKDAAMALGLDVALADDYFSDEERNFFRKSCIKINYPTDKFNWIFEEMKKKADEEVDKDVEVEKKLYGKTFYAIMSKIAPEKFREKFVQRYNRCLLSGADYSSAIKNMREISNEDIFYARNALQSISSEMSEFLAALNGTLENVKNESSKLKQKSEDEVQSVEKFLGDIKDQISNFVQESQKNISDSLKKKEISAKYYTISFMGRTKAGKSTLHSVILGGINREFIGVGKERTTRFNRIYKWKGIRIIDTPGIGAPGGKSDTEIAESIVDESDLICYVVTSDSIQDTEFKFLEKLKSQNKPILILLNKKENLSHPIHRKKFIERPLYWYERKDKDSIEGHLNRIKEYAEKYYCNAYFDIYPVQLMAAQMSMNEREEKLQKKLYDGSRLQPFLDDLRIQILKNGKIKRSQTILNGTIYLVGRYKNSFSKQISRLNIISASLSQKHASIIEKIKAAGEERFRSLQKGLNEIFETFIQYDIRSFANEHYGMKKEEIESEWKTYFENSGFEKKLQNRVNREIEFYKEVIEESILEFSENLTFDFGVLNVEFDLVSTFDTKKLISVTGTLIGFIGTILLTTVGGPVGWGLIVASWVASLLSAKSKLFESKEEKIKKARERLYDSIASSFIQKREFIVNEVIKKFKETTVNTEKMIDAIFQNLENHLHSLENRLVPLKNNLGRYEDWLNKLYALRILNFYDGENKLNLNDSQLQRHIIVYHDFSKKISITTDLIRELDTEQLSHILQEDVTFEFCSSRGTMRLS